MSSQPIGRTIRIEGQLVDVQLSDTAGPAAGHDASGRVGQPMSYVTIHSHNQELVGFVTAVSMPAATPQEPSPARVMTVQLLGSIRGGGFARGVHEYPSLDEPVFLATEEDFKDIFGSFDVFLKGAQHPRSFRLGQFAHQTKFEVRVLGTQFFSKHVAILGNSGSGKSCTVARVLHEVLKLGESQVVLFDLNGEYAAAFSDDGRIDPNVTYIGENDLIVPYWLLRYEELESLFVDRSNPLTISNQISFLKMALAELKRPAARALDLAAQFSIDTPIYFPIELLKTYAENLNEARYIVNTSKLAFADLANRSLDPARQEELLRSQRCRFYRGEATGEVPHPLYNGKLVGLIDQLDTRLSDRRYDFLLRPIDVARRSDYFRDALNPKHGPAELSGAMANLINVLLGRLKTRRNLTIVDLSGLPFDTVDVTVAVLTRIVFEFNFWSPLAERHPVLLVFEEAHNYIPRNPAAHSFARLAVEKVAKEGRKYGVAACIVSQRPGELSETALSQCNNMVVMRLNNPADQQYVQKVVSDHFASVVKTLPILLPGEGFVIGDSVLMPMQTLIDLPPRRPRSADVDFFRHWALGTPSGQADTILHYWWRQDRTLVRRSGKAPPSEPPAPPPPA